MKWKGTSCLLRSPLLAVLNMPRTIPGTLLMLEGSKEVPCIDTHSKSCNFPVQSLPVAIMPLPSVLACGFDGDKTMGQGGHFIFPFLWWFPPARITPFSWTEGLSLKPSHFLFRRTAVPQASVITTFRAEVLVSLEHRGKGQWTKIGT